MPPFRRPPRAFKKLEPLLDRAGLQLLPFEPEGGTQIEPRSRILRARRLLLERRGWTIRRAYPADLDEHVIEIIERTDPFTITSHERVAAMVASVEHVVHADLPGAIVECGVWKGGSMMAAALALLRLGVEDRDLYLYDTYDGMPPPLAIDYATVGLKQTAHERLDELNEVLRIGAAEVRANLVSTGYPESRIHLVEGKVEDTLPSATPEGIALLRLDTDWYESTAHEMKHLYPLLCEGGILMVDDYGEWAGARLAVDEYFGDSRPFLHRIDYTARLVVKHGGTSV